jgi:uncharacterized protein YdhG (YjbR/CyaY superfamily)
MPMKTSATVDSYLTRITPTQKAEYERIRQIVKQAVPEATEYLGYGVPAFKFKGKPLLYFGAFQRHMSLYPASDEMIAVVGNGLDKLRTSKGTLRFTEDNPIPEPVLREIVAYRLATIG